MVYLSYIYPMLWYGRGVGGLSGWVEGMLSVGLATCQDSETYLHRRYEE